MTESDNKRECLRCGKYFKTMDSLPLCPLCLFGIVDVKEVHGANRYRSILPNRRSDLKSDSSSDDH
jgi:hypothetical protein